MAQILQADGVPDHVIVQEDQSTTTLDNIRLALPLMQAHGVTRVFIVTDATHAPRAALVARHFGLQVVLRPPSLRGSRWRTVVRQAVRELGAYPLYAIRLRGTPRR